MNWEISVTEEFSKQFKKHRKDGEFVKALDRKIERLKENPHSVGDRLSGNLHGYKSTRITGKLRLIFKIVLDKNEVQLTAIDHRKFDYDRFNFT